MKRLIMMLILISSLTVVSSQSSSFGYNNPKLPQLEAQMSICSGCGGGGNSSFNQTAADLLYIRSDGTTTTTASIPFARGISIDSDPLGTAIGSIIFNNSLYTYLEEDKANINYDSSTDELLMHGMNSIDNSVHGGGIGIETGDGFENASSGILNIRTGDGGAENGNSGDVIITTGNPSGTGTRGRITLTGRNVLVDTDLNSSGDITAIDGRFKNIYPNAIDEDENNIGSPLAKFNNIYLLNGYVYGTLNVVNLNVSTTTTVDLNVTRTVVGNLNVSGSLSSVNLSLTGETNQIVFDSDSSMKTFLQDNAILTGDKYLSLPNLNGTLATTTVSGSGTGATTFNARGIVIGGLTTTGALQSTAIGTTGQYLRGVTSNNPIWSTLILPNSCTAGQIAYCSSLNNYGASTGLIYSGGVLTVGGTSATLTLADTDVGADDFDIDGSGDQLIIKNKDTVVNIMTVKNTGGITFDAGADNFIALTDGDGIQFGSTNGNKLGTATTQKLGFWNATPIVQSVNTTPIDFVLNNTGLRQNGGIANFGTKVNATAGLDVTGGITQLNGNASINNYYGEMWNKSDTGFETIDLVDPDVYYKVINLSAGNLNGFTVSNGNLTALVSGVYLVHAKVGASATSSGGEYGMKVYINDVGQNDCYDHEQPSTTPIGFIISCMVNLNANDRINIRFDDHASPVRDLTLLNANINALRIGN